MDVYRATFQAKPEDIQKARQIFVGRFGQAAYDKYIEPFMRKRPSYIWASFPVLEKYAFISQLAVIMAVKKGEDYIPPPEFLAIDPPDYQVIRCDNCGMEIPDIFSMPGERFGRGRICHICTEDLAWAEVEAYCSQFHRSENSP
jgi:hypothetical protein